MKFVVAVALGGVLAVLLLRIPKPERRAIGRSGCLASADALMPRGPLSANDFVELERRCAFCDTRYRVRLYSDGRVEWHGDRGVQAVGDRSARVTSGEARRLIERFRSSGLWRLCQQLARDHGFVHLHHDGQGSGKTKAGVRLCQQRTRVAP